MSEKISMAIADTPDGVQLLPPASMASGYATLYPYTKPKTDGKARRTEGSYEENIATTTPWSPWGTNDQQPNIIRRKIKSSPMAAQAIYRMVQMMYGNGLCYYRNDDPDQTRATSPKIDRWMRLNRIQTALLPAMFTDWRMYNNAFCELIFTGDNARISNIYHKPAIFCRLEVQNQKTYKIDHLYYSPQYAEGFQPSIDEIVKIKLFDWYDQRSFLDGLAGRKFAWHCKWPGGDPYYSEPFHIGLVRENGWLDVNNKVPEIVNAMMDNQITIKYLIQIPISYFHHRYLGFNDLPKHERDRLISNFIDDINSKLKGVDKTFTSIASLFIENEMSGQPEGKIEIIPIDEKVKKDAWVPSADHSNAQIVQTLGLHPSQMGLAPEGGKMGAGSGSDQREAFNTGIQLNTIEQDILLEPLNWIATYNAQTDPDWDVTFYIDHSYHTTTNNVETGVIPGDNAPGQNLIQ